jgi:hypothetical protein
MLLEQLQRGIRAKEVNGKKKRKNNGTYITF